MVVGIGRGRGRPKSGGAAGPMPGAVLRPLQTPSPDSLSEYSSGSSSELAVAPRRGRGCLASDVKRLTVTPGESDEGLYEASSTESMATSFNFKQLNQTREDALSLGPAPCVIPEPLEAGTAGARIPVKTNLFDVAIAPDAIVHKYRVDIESVNLLTGFTSDLGKGAGNDHVLNKKRELCYAVFQAVRHANPDIFKGGLAYDRRNMLVTTELLRFGDDEIGSVSLEVQPGELRNVEVPTKFTFSVKYDMRYKLSDFSQLTTRCLDDRDRAVQQILEVIVSQQFYNNSEGLVHFGAKTYERAGVKDVGNGRFLARGAYKSLVPTTNAQTQQTGLSLVLDNKLGAFYKAQEALATLAETLSKGHTRYSPKDFMGYKLSPQELKMAAENFKDVNVKDRATKRSFTIEGLSHESTNELKTKFKDMKNGGIEREVNLVDLYAQQYGYVMKYPKLQCFYFRGKGGVKKYYPIEVCVVNPDQRIPMAKQTPEQMQAMIKEAALKPTDLQKRLQTVARDSKLLHNETLKAFAVTMDSAPRKVTGRVLPKPGVQYGGRGGATAVKPNGDWQQGRNGFWSPASSKGWRAVCVTRVHPNLIGALEHFVGSIGDAGRAKGMKLPKPELKAIPPSAIKSVFSESARNGSIDFLLFVVPDEKVGGIKDEIKYHEAGFGIVTQCVTVSKALKIGKDEGGARQIVENIINKTNMKLGGLNYTLSLDRQKTVARWLKGERVLLLGCDVNHPPPQPAALRHLPPREPSVVGFVGNGPKNPLQFTGELAFQGPREEMVGCIDDLGAEFARRWLAQHSKRQLPEEIIYFRDGVSDGQFQHVMEIEVESLRAAFKAAAKGAPYSPKITALVAKKRHNFRMFKENVKEADKASFQDLDAGVVLDSASGVTHPGQANFYLKAHTALQGTARATHYTLLVNEGGYDQDELDQLIFTLCHCHQIVSKSVSLPAPVYGAHEMAERGKRIWRAYKNEEESSGTSSAFGEDMSRVDWAELTSRFRVGQFENLATAKHWA